MGPARAPAPRPATDPAPTPEEPESRLEEAPRSARCRWSGAVHRCSWLFPPGGRGSSVSPKLPTRNGPRQPPDGEPLLDVAEAPEVLLHLVGLCVGDRRLVRVHPGNRGRGGFARHQFGISAEELLQDPPGRLD